MIHTIKSITNNTGYGQPHVGQNVTL